MNRTVEQFKAMALQLLKRMKIRNQITSVRKVFTIVMDLDHVCLFVKRVRSWIVAVESVEEFAKKIRSTIQQPKSVKREFSHVQEEPTMIRRIINV